MTTDRWTTYNGFSGAGGGDRPLPDTGLRIERPERPQPPPRQFEPDEYRLPPRPRGPAGFGVSRKMLLGGVAAALGLGLLFGVVAKPDFGDAPAREPMRAVTPAVGAAAAPAVPIEVAAVTPQAVTPPPTGKLEVLPPELAKAAQARAPVAAPRRPTPVIEAPAPAPAPAAPEVREIPPAPPRIAAAPPRPVVQPSFNCRYASSRSERMVCGDPELARLDRRLDRAFERAVASGIPYRELRAEQDDWLSIREDAARRSPDAVGSIYRQRIAELEDLAG